MGLASPVSTSAPFAKSQRRIGPARDRAHDGCPRGAVKGTFIARLDLDLQAAVCQPAFPECRT